MTNQAADLRQIKFSEGVRLPILGIGLLGLALGVTAGVLTGVAVRNVIGDDPVISGSGAAVFYVSFGLAVLLDVFILFNFTNLAIQVTERGLSFRYGLFGKSFKWEQITNAEPMDYQWITYGGWGIRFSTKGRRAWSQLGTKRGVVVDVTEGNNQRRYFVSSNRADELAEVLNKGITGAGTVLETESSASGSRDAE